MKQHLLASKMFAKHKFAHPRFARFAEPKDLRKLQVGKGAQRRSSDAEIAERVLGEREMAVASGGRARRLTPLKISF